MPTAIRGASGTARIANQNSSSGICRSQDRDGNVTSTKPDNQHSPSPLPKGRQPVDSTLSGSLVVHRVTQRALAALATLGFEMQRRWRCFEFIDLCQNTEITPENPSAMGRAGGGRGENPSTPITLKVRCQTNHRNDCKYASKSCNSRRLSCVSKPCGMIDTRPGKNDSISSRPMRISTRSVVSK